MSRTTKIILGIVIALVVLCGCIAGGIAIVGAIAARQVTQFAKQNISVDATQVNQAAEAIASFSLPSGYKPAFSMNLLGFTMISYAGPDSNSLIMLMQYPATANLSPEELIAQMNRAMTQQQYSAGNTQMKIVEQKPVNIRGQEATLTISEGVSSNNVKLRQAYTTFQGKSGPVILMVVSDASTWDQAAIDAFLASIQ
jgi:hypothetical protein